MGRMNRLVWLLDAAVLGCGGGAGPSAIPSDVAVDRIGDDTAKMDLWMTGFSAEVGKNLGPFYETWGLPVSEEAKALISDLDPWAEDPMTAYRYLGRSALPLCLIKRHHHRILGEPACLVYGCDDQVWTEAG